MTIATTALALLCFALVGGVFQREIPGCNAFSLNRKSAVCRHAIGKTTVVRTTGTKIYMSEETEESQLGEESASDDNESTEEEEGPPEDPEVTALKESIAELEGTLADKKSKLQYELERCEEYSKSGYARKVADMENMKRVRSVSTIAPTTQKNRMRTDCALQNDTNSEMLLFH